MGKLNLIVEDAPVKVQKNDELYKEVAEAFNNLEIGKSVTVKNEELSSLAVIQNIKKYITLKDKVESIRISRLYGEDKKLSGVKLIKQSWKEPKVKSQGTTETSQESK